MRDRHLATRCRACHAPMAPQQDTCSRCRTQWATEDRPRTPLHAIPGGAPTDPVGRPRAVNEARPGHGPLGRRRRPRPLRDRGPPARGQRRQPGGLNRRVHCPPGGGTVRRHRLARVRAAVERVIALAAPVHWRCPCLCVGGGGLRLRRVRRSSTSDVALGAQRGCRGRPLAAHHAGQAARASEPARRQRRRLLSRRDGWSGASGEADRRTGRPLTPHTPMAIASVTKTFIAALVVKLAEDGRLRSGFRSRPVAAFASMPTARCRAPAPRRRAAFRESGSLDPRSCPSSEARAGRRRRARPHRAQWRCPEQRRSAGERPPACRECLAPSDAAIRLRRARR